MKGQGNRIRTNVLAAIEDRGGRCLKQNFENNLQLYKKL